MTSRDGCPGTRRPAAGPCASPTRPRHPLARVGDLGPVPTRTAPRLPNGGCRTGIVGAEMWTTAPRPGWRGHSGRVNALRRPTRDPIPPGGAIRTSDHAAFATTRARLRSSRVQHPFTGVSSIGLDLETVVDLCRAYEPLLRSGEAFSHATAALLYGAPLPAAYSSPSPLHIISPTVTRSRTSGTIGHRAASRIPITLRFGLPVVRSKSSPRRSKSVPDAAVRAVLAGPSSTSASVRLPAWKPSSDW
ncbi:MAG: hypothetical protein K0S05_3181 [Agromyces sp.]|nr:hypothetical protein [Agromyces sp.]